MTMFADCREKFMKNAYPSGTMFQKNEDIPKDEINPYWEGNLKGEGKAYVAGYDMCVEAVLKNFAANAAINEKMIDAFGMNFANRVDESVLADERFLDDIPEDEQAKWTKETLLMKVVQDILLDDAESYRDELVTSILEDDAVEKDDSHD